MALLLSTGRRAVFHYYEKAAYSVVLLKYYTGKQKAGDGSGITVLFLLYSTCIFLCHNFLFNVADTICDGKRGDKWWFAWRQQRRVAACRVS